MILEPYLTWLGFRAPDPVAGLHITSTYMTLVAVRARPVRIVAVGRRPIIDAAVVDDEIRLVSPLVADLELLVTKTRLELGTLVVATVEPVASSVTIWDDGPEVLSYNVAESTYNRIGEVVDQAGLQLARIDIVPASLARLGRHVNNPSMAGTGPNAWSVVTNDGFTDAKRGDGDPNDFIKGLDVGLDTDVDVDVDFDAGGGLDRPVDHADPGTQTAAGGIGLAMRPAVPVPDLSGLDLPIPLRGLIDPANDSAAVGAALACFGLPPLVTTQPLAEAAGPDWTVQYVEPLYPDHET